MIRVRHIIKRNRNANANGTVCFKEFSDCSTRTARARPPARGSSNSAPLESTASSVRGLVLNIRYACPARFRLRGSSPLFSSAAAPSRTRQPLELGAPAPASAMHPRTPGRAPLPPPPPTLCPHAGTLAPLRRHCALPERFAQSSGHTAGGIRARHQKTTLFALHRSSVLQRNCVAWRFRGPALPLASAAVPSPSPAPRGSRSSHAGRKCSAVKYLD